MGSTQPGGAVAWRERTRIALIAASLVLVAVEATIAVALAALIAGLGGAAPVLWGLGASLLGFVGWGVAGLAAALLAVAAARAVEGPVSGRLMAGAGLSVVGVAGTIANTAGGVVVAADALVPRPRTPFQLAVGLVALVCATLGAALIADALGGDRPRIGAYVASEVGAGTLAVAGLELALDPALLVAAVAALVGQVVLLGVLWGLSPDRPRGRPVARGEE